MAEGITLGGDVDFLLSKAYARWESKRYYLTSCYLWFIFHVGTGRRGEFVNSKGKRQSVDSRASGRVLYFSARNKPGMTKGRAERDSVSACPGRRARDSVSYAKTDRERVGGVGSRSYPGPEPTSSGRVEGGVKLIDASPFWVGTPQIWYGRWVSAKGLSKGTPDFESGPKLPILFEAGPNSKAFDASSAGPASVKI